MGRVSPRRRTISGIATRAADSRITSARGRVPAGPASRSRISSERSAGVGCRTNRLGTSATHHLSLEGGRENHAKGLSGDR